MKIYAAIILVSLLIGAYLGNKLHKPDETLATQSQSTECHVVKTVKTLPDGSKEEIIDFKSTAKQDQNLVGMNQIKGNKNKVFILKDELGYSRTWIETSLGNISPLITVNREKEFKIGVLIEF